MAQYDGVQRKEMTRVMWESNTRVEIINVSKAWLGLDPDWAPVKSGRPYAALRPNREFGSLVGKSYY